MQLGTLPKAEEMASLDRWYIGVEFLRCPFTMGGVFRPEIRVWCFKVIDYGEPYKMFGSEPVRKGFFWKFTSPVGLRFTYYG